MLATVGKPVTYLKRLRMGELWLDETLELGEYRPLTEAECNNYNLNNHTSIKINKTQPFLRKDKNF